MRGEVLTEYPSKSKPGKSYEIIRGRDGKTYCTCWQWKINKDCKHLRDFLSSAPAQKYKVRKQKADKGFDTYLDLEKAISQAVEELS